MGNFNIHGLELWKGHVRLGLIELKAFILILSVISVWRDPNDAGGFSCHHYIPKGSCDHRTLSLKCQKLNSKSTRIIMITAELSPTREKFDPPSDLTTNTLITIPTFRSLFKEM